MLRTTGFRVRKGKVEDAFDLALLVKEFMNTSGHAKTLGFNAEKTVKLMERMASEGIFHLNVLEDSNGNVVGVFGGLLTDCMFSNAKQATELVWYVTPSARGSRGSVQLLLEWEKWAKLQGAKTISMMNLESVAPREVERLYERMNYVKSENTYTKEL